MIEEEERKMGKTFEQARHTGRHPNGRWTWRTLSLIVTWEMQTSGRRPSKGLWSLLGCAHRWRTALWRAGCGRREASPPVLQEWLDGGLSRGVGDSGWLLLRDHFLHGDLWRQGMVKLIVTPQVLAPSLERKYNWIKVRFVSDSIFNNALILNKHAAYMDVIFTSGVLRTYAI